MDDPSERPFATIAPASAQVWESLNRPTPAWHPRAKLGIFIHWGAYSVPAWAQPGGAHGTLQGVDKFTHCPYAEWYGNTMRIPGSPTALHHQEVYGDAPYDAFLDQWTVDQFDPAAWLELFAQAGADVVIPTTKHHDGVALWDAPGTGTRNTVHRGPRRDLIGEIATATRAAGLRFGVYYSGGLDWSIFPPEGADFPESEFRPNDNAYNMYALAHLRDLVERFEPDVLWNDINWPDAGKRTGPGSLHEFLTDYYRRNPDGVINDRWGQTHCDFRTSEYEARGESESVANWEHCRGIGLSFGYNQIEGADQYLNGRALARLLGDIVSRNGRLLLNIGPTAEGAIPQLQQEALRGLGRWMQVAKELLVDGGSATQHQVEPSDDPWVRWLRTPRHLIALVDHLGTTPLAVPHMGFDLGRAAVRPPVIGPAATAAVRDGALEVTMLEHGDGPAIITIPVA
ncbi:alpha-L-fucosidase [Leekyejoonella antrihumi]|uniref:alpha-L-fucosidase n=1 Tax=Leekyejoonella antrihumi TaxID=1660198 RepID=A0A563DV47_9MICO|nr:alpha-L-fucosidase [Leekyejoonella antrihumi]TWP34130.1 alpha-L-fucosidase [Leekyejoonella antrihumi]